MRVLLPAVAMASLGVAGWSLAPLASRPAPRVLQAEGLKVVRHPEQPRIDAVLARRAPGMGLALRAHVADAVAEESARAGFDPLLVLAVIAVESEFQEDAVSPVGARGLMQLRPTTLYFVAEKEGVKLSRAEMDADPALSVRIGVRYLKQMKDLFGDLDLALMAYNAGPNRLLASLKERNLEPFRNYVRAVRRNYTALRQASGESGDWAFASRQ